MSRWPDLDSDQHLFVNLDSRSMFMTSASFSLLLFLPWQFFSHLNFSVSNASEALGPLALLSLFTAADWAADVLRAFPYDDLIARRLKRKWNPGKSRQGSARQGKATQNRARECTQGSGGWSVLSGKPLKPRVWAVGRSNAYIHTYICTDI